MRAVFAKVSPADLNPQLLTVPKLSQLVVGRRFASARAYASANSTTK